MTKRPSAAQLLAESSLPRPEAEFLLEHLLHCRRHEMYLSASPVPARARRRFLSLARRARSGEPVQYLVHSAPFLDFNLYVDRRVLIPRPETEELVLRAAGLLRKSQITGHSSRVIAVDYGTGSGCIAIALARMFPRARILAVDSSAPALAVCRRNARTLGVAGRVSTLLASDLGHPEFARLRGRMSLLISNPPYIPTARLSRLEPRVRDFEPRAALDGGPKGTNIVAMLVQRGPELLEARGLLAMEIDSSHARFLARLAPAANVERDLAGRVRYLFLRKEA